MDLIRSILSDIVVILFGPVTLLEVSFLIVCFICWGVQFKLLSSILSVVGNDTATLTMLDGKSCASCRVVHFFEIYNQPFGFSFVCVIGCVGCRVFVYSHPCFFGTGNLEGLPKCVASWCLQACSAILAFELLRYVCEWDLRRDFCVTCERAYQFFGNSVCVYFSLWWSLGE